MRGTLLPIQYRQLSPSVEDQFAFSIENIPVIDEAELHAGKICAGLSRQHPRDFFDIKELLDNRGLSDSIRRAFVVYLTCSPRPMHELLQPNQIDIEQIYQNEFSDMTEEIVSLSALLDTRDELISTLQKSLTLNERKFILSVKQGDPLYDQLPFSTLEQMPALQWKLINIKKMDPAKHKAMLHRLRSVLEL